MVTITYDFDPSCFITSTMTVRVSSDSNNAAYIDEHGQIALRGISGSINQRNTPGDGFDGEFGKPLPILRFNSTVSRKVSGDPTPSNEGVCIPDMLAGYWASKGLDPD